MKILRMKNEEDFNIIDFNNFELKYNELISILKSSNRFDLRLKSSEDLLSKFIFDYDGDFRITKKLIQSIKYYCYQNYFNKKTMKVVNSISLRRIRNKVKSMEDNNGMVNTT